MNNGRVGIQKNTSNVSGDSLLRIVDVFHLSHLSFIFSSQKFIPRYNIKLDENILLYMQVEKPVAYINRVNTVNTLFPKRNHTYPTSRKVLGILGAHDLGSLTLVQGHHEKSGN